MVIPAATRGEELSREMVLSPISLDDIRIIQDERERRYGPFSSPPQPSFGDSEGASSQLTLRSLCRERRLAANDAILAQLYGLSNDCVALVGAKRRPIATLMHTCPSGRRVLIFSLVPRCADEITRLVRAAKSHREKCATLLGICLNARLALEQARLCWRASTQTDHPFTHGCAFCGQILLCTVAAARSGR